MLAGHVKRHEGKIRIRGIHAIRELNPAAAVVRSVLSISRSDYSFHSSLGTNRHPCGQL